MKSRNFRSISPLRLCLAGALVMLSACASRTPPPAAAGPTGPVAFLKGNIGGEGAGAPRRPRYAVLELHVIDGRHHVQPVAQCEQVYTGRALGGGTERELQVALCDGDWNNDGEYWLISEPGVLTVRRVAAGNDRQTVLEYRLRDVKARAVAQ